MLEQTFGEQKMVNSNKYEENQKKNRRMTTSLQVRSYKDEDLEQVMTVANRAFRKIRTESRAALGDLISDLLRPAGDDVSKGLEVKNFVSQHPENCLVCEAGGKIVGFATFLLGSNRIGTICNNGADPEAHVRGVGRTLYREILRIFREKRMMAACVTTGLGDEFAPARRAYEKAGFDRSMSSIQYYMEL